MMRKIKSLLTMGEHLLAAFSMMKQKSELVRPWVLGKGSQL